MKITIFTPGFFKGSIFSLILIVCVQILTPAKSAAQLFKETIVLTDSVSAPKLISDTSGTDVPIRILPPDSIFIQKTRKYDLKNEIINMIVVQPNDPFKRFNDLDHFELVNTFIPYKDKVIRSIVFKQLEVFGQNISDTSIKPENDLQRLGNGLHINTQTQILNNRLIQKTGDRLNPMLLADNERLIRELPNIQDVRIVVSETSPQSDSVDLVIITKDVWPIGLGFELYDVNSGITGIWDNNLLGLGHELNYYLLWNLDKSPKYGHKLRYRINNIAHTFISADASYLNKWNEESYKLYFNRGFYTPQTKYAGGAGFESNKLISDIEFPDTIFTEVKVEYNYYDLWLGRALILNISPYKKIRSNIAITGRIVHYDYFKRPEVTESSLYQYHSRTVFLGSIGISRQAFMKSRLIYGFGKTEDIPYGSLFNITTGHEINEFKSRIYFGSNASIGSYIGKLGFLYQKIEYGGFFNSGIEQGVIKYTGKYFTRLLNPAGRFRYRMFFNINYALGINRYKDEFIELSDIDGVRGLKGSELRGDQKAYLKIESDCYSPHSLIGFRFTYFLFADFGIVNNKHDNLFSNKVYNGFGIGIRIRNEHLVFNTVQIRFAYYPLYPQGADWQYIELTGLSENRPEYFSNTKPEIVKF